MNVFITILTTRSYPHLRRGKKKTNVPWDCLQKSLFFFFSSEDKQEKGKGFPGSSDGKESACNVGDLGSIPGTGRSPRERNGNSLQYSYLENPMDGGAWWAIVYGVTKSSSTTERLSPSLSGSSWRHECFCSCGPQAFL